MKTTNILVNVLCGATAIAFFSAPSLRSADNGPVLSAAISFVSPKDSDSVVASALSAVPVLSPADVALNALSGLVVPLSHPRALEDAFRGYFAYKTAHPADVKKPYLYFVDFGLPSNKPRGYVFDMVAQTIVDGPFMVAQGRGSAPNKAGVPTVFSNRSGSATTSLGLYLADKVYGFTGHAGGRAYASIGLRLKGQSTGFNDNAFARGVVAHGAPYVTSTKAGRSEGCPAMEPARAERLLPKLANGGVVFLFAPQEKWMANDPWVADKTASDVSAD